MCEILWYGERGIINALVCDLADQGVEAFGQFLRAIHWADGLPHQWTNDVRSVTCLVEIGLGRVGFGDPDLIMICRTSAGEIHVIFIEAKVTTYFASALPNNPGMAAEGFNSSINGQLSLKYRCARALSAWNGQHPVLSEPTALHAAYAQPAALGGLSDPMLLPRHLAQPMVLHILANHGIHTQLPFDRYHFVAMTWDNDSYWNQQAVINGDLLPRLLEPLSPGGPEADVEVIVPQGIWPKLNAQFGWIGIGDLGNQQVPVGERYRWALATMVDTPMPRREPDLAGLRTLKTVNLANFQAHTLNLLRALEVAAITSFGQRAVKRGRGSSSVTIRGKVCVKFLPQKSGPNEHVNVGISTSLSPAEWCALDLSEPVLIGGQPFLVWSPQAIGQEEVVAIAEGLFQQIAERLDLGD